MLDTLLHVGTDHPDLLWLGVAGLLTFGAGLGIGLFSRHRDPTADEDATDDTEEAAAER
jgi:hypothetical protein